VADHPARTSLPEAKGKRNTAPAQPIIEIPAKEMLHAIKQIMPKKFKKF
jgi:hypothetical protein